MTDNGTAASGPTIAWDDIGGVVFQRVKLTTGPDGTAIDVSSSDPLPVSIISGGSSGLTDAELRASAVPVSGTFWQATQPVSIAATVAVSGPLTDTQLRATAVPVSGTFWQTTQPVSLASLPALATGSNIVGAVTQSGTWNVTVSNSSIPVTDNGGSLTVDNGGTFAVQAAQSGTWNVTNVSGTVSLPTGASTAAKQPALGTAGTASADVISVQGVASMTPLDINADTLPLPTGAATEAKQDTLIAAVNATATELPPQPVVAVSPFVVTIVTRSTSGTTSILAAGGAAVNHRVHRWAANWKGAVDWRIEDGDGNDLIGGDFAAAGFWDSGRDENPIIWTPNNKALQLTTVGAVKVEVTTWTKSD